MLLSVRQATLKSIVACFCEAPDEGGAATMPAELLALFDSEPDSCTVHLERLNVSTVSHGNATVQLIAETAVGGTASIP